VLGSVVTLESVDDEPSHEVTRIQIREMLQALKQQAFTLRPHYPFELREIVLRQSWKMTCFQKLIPGLVKQGIEWWILIPRIAACGGTFLTEAEKSQEHAHRKGNPGQISLLHPCLDRRLWNTLSPSQLKRPRNCHTSGHDVFRGVAPVVVRRLWNSRSDSTVIRW
jgi:hypothetical protein